MQDELEESAIPSSSLVAVLPLIKVATLHPATVAWQLLWQWWLIKQLRGGMSAAVPGAPGAGTVSCVVSWVLLELSGLRVMAQSHGLSSCVRVTVSYQGLQNCLDSRKTQRNWYFSGWSFVLRHGNWFSMAEICCLDLSDVLTVGLGDTACVWWWWSQVDVGIHGLEGLFQPR